LTDTRTIRIFASSPSDLDDERNQLAAVVQELNSTVRALVLHRTVELELVRWETHTYPNVGSTDAQGIVDEQLGDDFDIYVGMMWSRFGTPTSRAGSGTEHELRAALAGKRARGRPAHILFYFCDEPSR
jgi:hypothetical protein